MAACFWGGSWCSVVGWADLCGYFACRWSVCRRRTGRVRVGGSPGGGSGVCEGPLGLECPGGPALPAEWLADLLGAEVFVG